MIHLGVVIHQKKFQLKRNKIDQSMALSIWGVECGEDITKVSYYIPLWLAPCGARLSVYATYNLVIVND